MKISLVGRVALVTGASSGIGAAIAQRLHDCGASVVVTGRNQDTIDAAAAIIGIVASGSPPMLRRFPTSNASSRPSNTASDGSTSPSPTPPFAADADADGSWVEARRPHRENGNSDYPAARRLRPYRSRPFLARAG